MNTNEKPTQDKYESSLSLQSTQIKNPTQDKYESSLSLQSTQIKDPTQDKYESSLSLQNTQIKITQDINKSPLSVSILNAIITIKKSSLHSC